MRTKICLFDIDGTLLKSAGAGLKAFEKTFFELYGWENAVAKIRFAGTTDLLVVRNVFEERGHPVSEKETQRVFSLLSRKLHEELETLKKASWLHPDQTPKLMPDVTVVLEQLGQMSGVRLGLVTGNTEACAMHKLGFFGIESSFEGGGFGDDHEDRSEIVAHALRRLGARGQEEVWLVGDTPADILAGRQAGVKVLAVTTGWCKRQDLEEHAPDEVVDRLSEWSLLKNP